VRNIESTDGVRLAVYESGDASAPTVVCVHGWPDDHHLWDGVAEELADRFHVVTYDVRGAGASDKPRGSWAYRLGQLAADLRTVIDDVSPDLPVHLLAHDWGSATGWALVCDELFAPRISSYTSISAPSVDHAGAWLRTALEHPLPVLKQARDSYYMFLFQLPVLPELLVRTGVVGRFVRAAGSGVQHRRSDADARHGLALYRANLLPRLVFPRPQSTTVPVQILAPTEDRLISRELQVQAAAPWTTRLVVRDIEGDHWVPSSHPKRVAERFVQFVSSLT